MKIRGLSIYGHGVSGHPAPTSIEAMASRHRGVGSGGNLRAAVFGVNDGLVSNLSLILGIAGTSSSNSMVVLAGVAGMLAGEYVSVRSQREMFEYQIGLEREELATYPAEEAEELALIYSARGMTEEDAARLAKASIADPDLALDMLAREELGLNPDQLGSPMGAAVFSLISFAAGALVPLLPFLFLAGDGALGVSVVVTAVALYAVGALLSLFIGRNAWLGGLRMLAIGAAAGAATYTIGSLLGVSLA